MVKASPWGDTFEKTFEFGKSTGKQTVEALKQTFSPLKMLETVFSKQSNEDQIEKNQSKKENNSPLDLKKLQENYKNQDKFKADALRNRLFVLVKQGDEKMLQENKQKIEEDKRQETYEKQEKERKKQKLQRSQQQTSAPHGKERKSIFSHKKVAQREQVEVKPASGKQ